MASRCDACGNEVPWVVSIDEDAVPGFHGGQYCGTCLERMRDEAMPERKRVRELEAEVERQKEIAQHCITTLHDRSVKMQADLSRLRALCAEVAQCKHRAVGIGGQMCGAGMLRVDMSEALFGKLDAAGRGEGMGNG